MSESQALGLSQFLDGACFEGTPTAVLTVSDLLQPWITFSPDPRVEMTLGKIWLLAVLDAITKRVIAPWRKWVGLLISHRECQLGLSGWCGAPKDLNQSGILTWLLLQLPKVTPRRIELPHKV